MTYGAQASGVCLTGWAAATPVGESGPATAAAVRGGIAGFHDHPTMIDLNGDPFVVSAAPYLPEDLAIGDRIAKLTVTAASELVACLAAVGRTRLRVQVVLGLPEPRPGLPPDLSQTTCEALEQILRKSCEVVGTRVIPCGHAAGLMAIQEAWNLVMSGAAEFCVAGGADSYVDDDTLAWIEDSFQLHNASNAYGFIPGEAAGLALLTSKESASEHHLGVLAEILSITTTQEHHRIKTDSVCTGVGMTEAVRQVLRALPDDQSQVDQVFCDQNGETYRANEYGFTLTRTGEWFVDGSDFLAPADCWGDVGAASGPLLLGLASSAASGAYTKGPLSLLSTSSEGGHRCVALVRTRDEKDGPV